MNAGKSPPRLRAAIDYAVRMGWDVFLVPPGMKKSYKSAAHSDGAKWGKTKDPDQLKQDFERWHDANIGIPTGADNGFWVLEADTAAGHSVDGIAELRKLEDEHGKLPETRKVISPSGSEHYYFKWPTNGTIRNSASEFAPGVDVRGEGGMVIAPPSVKPGVGEYRLVCDAPIVDAPDWVIARLTTKQKDASKALDRSTDDQGVPLVTEDAAMIAAAMEVVPNPDFGFDEWNDRGMAIYRATDGSDEGFAIFDRWSEKSKDKYDADYTRDKWNGYAKCPPIEIGAGSIFHWADEADPEWKDAYDASVAVAAAAEMDAIRAAAVDHGKKRADNDSFPSVNIFAASVKASTAPKPKAEPAPKVILRPHEFPAEDTIPLREFLYGYHLLRNTVSCTAAAGAAGKSSKSIAEALAMTTGKSLLGVLPPGPLRVLLINLEDDRNEMNRRIQAAMIYYELKPEDVGDRLIVVAKNEMRFKIAIEKRNSVFPQTDAINMLTDHIITNKIDVVSIDPLRKTHSVNENNNGAIGDMIECYDAITEATRCAIHLWHHVRKSGGGETTIESLRGASAFVNSFRSVNMMETMTDDEAKKFGIDKHRRKYYFRSFSGKLNFAPPIEKFDWFEIKSVMINGFDGDDVGVVTRLDRGMVEVELTPVIIEEARDKVGVEPRWRDDVRAGMWVGKAIAQVLGKDPDDDKDAVKAAIKKLITIGVLKTEPGLTTDRHNAMFVVAVPRGSE